MYTELQILQKTYDMILYGNICLKQFPKYEKHVMSAQIRGTMYELLRLIIRANKRYKQENSNEIPLYISTLRGAFWCAYLKFGRRDMNSEITVAIIAFFGTIVGSSAGVLASSKSTNHRLKELEDKVKEHNNIATRTHVLEEKIKTANHRIKDLEDKI